ncbi:MAG: formylmethanofuran dehydrogenase subunit C [Methanosphaera sp. rholeuAM130]|nr:formylmethanofuran dehydrogenase subunit C [Methanosphaera sp.]RAP53990.1 MAG: formylmethanofuran dehydrogenase subunit C [Methanosphaera sp. rholeuAM130]
MRTIEITMKESVKIPLEFDNVLPELLYDKSIDEIEDTLLYQGNRQKKLSEFFKIDIRGSCEDASDCKLVINGKLDRIKYIANKMSCGMIIANGDVDLHAGSMMSGGHLIVNGNAESYLGREMTGGLIEVKGSVREFCGSSYVGEWRGMNGGSIIIEADAGKQLADCMLKGHIHVKGNCDILPGVHMAGGFIQIDGDVESWPGGQMKKGTIVVNGHIKDMLQGFKLKEIVHTPLINGRYFFGRYKLYIGDIGANGKGQLWVKIR